jgi:hypothetical protein
LALAVTWTSGSATSSHAGNDCEYFNGDLAWVEWLEGSKPRGARLILDDRWQEARTLHGQWLAYETASVNAAVSGWLRLDLPPFMDREHTEKLKTDRRMRDASRIDFALSPDAIELAILGMRGVLNPIGLFAVTQPQPVTVAGLPGFARVVGVTAGERVVHATAVVIEDGCFLMSGLFSAKDGRQLSVEELGFLNSTVRVERYEPAPPVRDRPATAPRRRSFEDFRRGLGLD